MPEPGTLVLLTRPQAASERVARALLGEADVLIAPVVSIVPVGEIPPLDAVGALILTSANAAERLEQVPTGLPAYCVGDRTAAVAEGRGCHAISAGGDADALVTRVLADKPPGPLLHLRGEASRGDVVARLSEAGLTAESLVIYRQDVRPLDDTVRARLALAPAVVAPVYSPASARTLSSAWPEDAPPPHLVAISDAAAKEWHGALASLRIAASPDGAAMLSGIRTVLAAVGPCP